MELGMKSLILSVAWAVKVVLPEAENAAEVGARAEDLKCGSMADTLARQLIFLFLAKTPPYPGSCFVATTTRRDSDV